MGDVDGSKPRLSALKLVVLGVGAAICVAGWIVGSVEVRASHQLIPHYVGNCGSAFDWGTTRLFVDALTAIGDSGPDRFHTACDAERTVMVFWSFGIIQVGLIVFAVGLLLRNRYAPAPPYNPIVRSLQLWIRALAVAVPGLLAVLVIRDLYDTRPTDPSPGRPPTVGRFAMTPQPCLMLDDKTVAGDNGSTAWHSMHNIAGCDWTIVEPDGGYHRLEVDIDGYTGPDAVRLARAAFDDLEACQESEGVIPAAANSCVTSDPRSDYKGPGEKQVSVALRDSNLVVTMSWTTNDSDLPSIEKRLFGLSNELWKGLHR